MTYQTMSELLILGLILISCLRIFFTRRVQSDAIAIVPLIAFIISILNIFAWGFNPLDAVIFILAAFVFIWNLRALLRLGSNLVVDHYNPLFILISIINIIPTAILLAAIFYFRPAEVNLKKYDVTRETKFLTGNISEGLKEIETPLEKKTVKLTTYVPKEHNGKTVLFVPPKTTDSTTYQPFFAKLAHDGYLVHTIDCYMNEISWMDGIAGLDVFTKFNFIKLKRSGEENYKKYIIHHPFNYMREYEAIVQASNVKKEDFVFLVTEQDYGSIMTRTQSAHNDVIDGTFDLSIIKSYSTPGYGPVEQTNPLLANVLGMERDHTAYMASHIAKELEKVIDFSYEIPLSGQ